MDTRVAVISIIVERNNSIETLNQLLYDARDHIIGWVSHTVKKESASSVLPLMLHRISSVLFPARLAD